MDGGSPLCERKVIRFGNEESLGYVQTYPILCLRIEPANVKFAESLSHRDFLGAIMNLGIERDTVGDIFVQEKEAHLFCLESIAFYLAEHLEQVRHTRVKCLVSEIPGKLAMPSTETVTVSVASPRIDAVVSKLYNVARSQSQEMFGAGRIFVQGRLTENGSYILKPGDTVTVRGYGRFIYTGEQERQEKVSRESAWRFTGSIDADNIQRCTFMFGYNGFQWLFFFYLYCFLGWCFESTYVSLKSRKLVNRGFMRGPFLPLYGSGAIMMLVVSMPFRDNVLLTYIAGVIGATALEYVTGVVMEALLKSDIGIIPKSALIFKDIFVWDLLWPGDFSQF